MERKFASAVDWEKSQKKGTVNKIGEDYHRMLIQRQKLPTYQLRTNIVDTIRKNQVTVIAGETGSG